MKAEEYYLEYFHTTKPPQGVDVLEKDYTYRDLISFAKGYAEELLEQPDTEPCQNCGTPCVTVEEGMCSRCWSNL